MNSTIASIRTASREPGGVARRSVRNGQDPARRGPVRHVAGALDSPFVALFHGDGADQTHDRGLVQGDADNLDGALDRADQPLDGIRAVQLDPVFLSSKAASLGSLGRI